MSEKKVISVNIPEHLIAPAKQMASDDNRSLSSFIASLIQGAINKKAAIKGS